MAIWQDITNPTCLEEIPVTIGPLTALHFVTIVATHLGMNLAYRKGLHSVLLELDWQQPTYRVLALAHIRKK